MRNNGVQSDIVDLAQGRINSVFVRNYYLFNNDDNKDAILPLL